MFDKKDSGVNKQIVGFTKPKKILFFTIKPRPIYKNNESQQSQSTAQVAARLPTSKLEESITPALVDLGIKMTAKQYIGRSKAKAALIAIASTALSGAGLYLLLGNPELLILALMIGIAVYLAVFNALARLPLTRGKNVGAEVEKDILFAARDMIVSMRSGLPLFNAILLVSSGYGASSREFKKIIDRVQLGTPMEQAIEEVSEKSESKTFKRLMLQASMSIKVGADVVGTIQEVISDVSRERTIELRRYGQKLNAIAMFYMLFGIIFPSMGLAVASIMSTFISLFPINNSTLMLAALAIILLQFIFLKMVTSSRPPLFST